MESALELAEKIANCSPVAIKISKQAVSTQFDSDYKRLSNNFAEIIETVTIIYVTMSIFYPVYPVLLLLGIDPIHFAIILIVNIELALITSPVGLNLYVMSGACKEPFERVVRGVFPFIITMILGLLIITYWPGVSLYLDKIFYR